MLKGCIFFVCVICTLWVHAQTAQEKRDYEQMLTSTTEQSAEQFCKKYPNSVYKEDAMMTWQTRMLQSARQLEYAPAIQKLQLFKQQFPNSPLYSLARSTYELKWSEAQAFTQKKYIEARNYKNDYVKRRTKRLGKDLLLTPLYFGAGYAIGYYGIDKNHQQGMTFGAITGGVALAVPLSSFSVKTGPYKRTMNNWKAQADYYSGQPNF